MDRTNAMDARSDAILTTTKLQSWKHKQIAEPEREEHWQLLISPEIHKTLAEVIADAHNAREHFLLEQSTIDHVIKQVNHHTFIRANMEFHAGNYKEAFRLASEAEDKAEEKIRTLANALIKAEIALRTVVRKEFQVAHKAEIEQHKVDQRALKQERARREVLSSIVFAQTNVEKLQKWYVDYISSDLDEDDDAAPAEEYIYLSDADIINDLEVNQQRLEEESNNTVDEIKKCSALLSNARTHFRQDELEKAEDLARECSYTAISKLQHLILAFDLVKQLTAVAKKLPAYEQRATTSMRRRRKKKQRSKKGRSDRSRNSQSPTPSQKADSQKAKASLEADKEDGDDGSSSGIMSQEDIIQKVKRLKHEARLLKRSLESPNLVMPEISLEEAERLKPIQFEPGVTLDSLFRELKRMTTFFEKYCSTIPNRVTRLKAVVDDVLAIKVRPVFLNERSKQEFVQLMGEEELNLDDAKLTWNTTIKTLNEARSGLIRAMKRVKVWKRDE